jgi:hypothetical protein
VKSKFQEDHCPEFSVHDYAFKMLIADIHEDVTPRSQWGIRWWKCLFSRCHASRFEWQRAIFGDHCKNLQQVQPNLQQ